MLIALLPIARIMFAARGCRYFVAGSPSPRALRLAHGPSADQPADGACYESLHQWVERCKSLAALRQAAGAELFDSQKYGLGRRPNRCNRAHR
jgi:hypothetical protein